MSFDIIDSTFISRVWVRFALTLLFPLLGDVVQGLLILFLTFTGCNSVAAIICLTAATAAHGSVSTGPLASMVDISPNFASTPVSCGFDYCVVLHRYTIFVAGIILGISGMISVLPGFISPIIVGQLTFQNVSSTAFWWSRRCCADRITADVQFPLSAHSVQSRDMRLSA